MVWRVLPMQDTMEPSHLIDARLPLAPRSHLLQTDPRTVTSHNSPENDWHAWILERRTADGAILVRVTSLRADAAGERLPDAVFSFRDGDPQYSLWAERFAERHGLIREERRA